MKKICFHKTLSPLLGLLLGLPTLAWGQEPLPDKFKIDVGAFFVTKIKTDVQLAAEAGPINVGTRISFDEDLNLSSRETVPRLDGYYRFGKRSRVDFSYWKIDRDATAVLGPTQTIEFGDITILPNETVNSFFDTETIKASYGLSFYNVPKAELGLSAGLHVTSMDVGITCLTCAIPNTAEAADATVPLPVVGFYFRYNISRRWAFRGSSQVFFIDLDEFEGSLTDLRLNVEHHTFKHAGFGFGFNRVAIELEADDGEFRGDFDNTLSGWQAYVFAAFGTAKYQQ